MVENPSVSYRAMQQQLQVAHGVTTGNDTMQRWLKALREGPRKRPAPQYQTVTTISELNEYSEWARGHLDANEALT